MKKKVLIACIIVTVIFVAMIICWDLYVEIETTYKGLEFVIPILCKREVTTLSYNDLFDDEKLEKIFLSKGYFFNK